MAYKKTWLSYVIWAVFTCITGVMLANYTILFWTKEIDSKVGIGTVAFVFGVFAAVVGVYFLLHKVIFSWIQNRSINKKIMLFLEGAVVFLALGGGLVCRIGLCMQTNAETIVETAYYQQAMVKTGTPSEPMIHGASYLYTLCLSFVLSFLGNKTIAGVWFQIVLQMLAMVVAYIIVRKMIGRQAACITLILLAASSVYANQIFSLTPENFYFLLYLFGMLIVGSFVRSYTNGDVGKTAVVVFAVLTGIVMGGLLYLDAIAVSLWILLVGIFTGIRHSQESEKKFGIGFSFLVFGIVFAAALLSFVAFLAIDGVLSQTAFIKVAEAWFSLYRSYLPMGYILYQTRISIMECLIQVMLAALLIMAFWNQGREQKCSPYICYMLLLAPTPLAISGVLSYQVFSIFIWSILAGIGFQQCFVKETIEVKVESAEKAAVPEPTEVLMPQLPESTEVLMPQLSEPTEVLMPQAPEPKALPKPRFLENPLPLPKKHEKKEMDYQYSVAEDKMKFDTEIKDNDDFDIK